MHGRPSGPRLADVVCKPVIDNVLVARTGNNDSKEYWLARATTKPRRSTPLDDEDIPPNTLVVEVCMCVHAYVCL